MANRIKGITIEIDGNTTKLDRALEGTNKELKSTQNHLRDVDRLLKIDPKNTIALTQKQHYLAEAIKATKDKIEKLQYAMSQADAAMKRGDMNIEQYRALERELIQNTQELKKFEQQAKSSNVSLSKFTTTVEDASAKSKKAAEKLNGVSKTVKAIGVAAVATIPATEDFRDGLSKLKTTADRMNVSLADAEAMFRDFYGIAGDTDAAFEATNNLLNLKAESEDLTKAVDLLSGAVVLFPETMKIESLADSLQETIATGEATGQFAELLGRLGIDTEQFANSLSMYTDESNRLNIALSALASQGLADSTEAWEAENQGLMASRDAKIDMQMALSKLANDMTPLITKVTELAQAFLDWFNGLSDRGKTAIGVIGALVLAINPVSNALGGISSVIKLAHDWIGKLVIAIGPASKALSGISSVAKTAHEWLGKMDIKTGALVAILAVLAASVVSVLNAWKDMSGPEKALSVFGLLLITLSAVAVAMGALTKGALGAALVSAALLAGITAVTIGVNSAKKRAEQQSMRDIPKLADGAVLPANKPFLAMVGDQKHGTNIEAPMGTIKQGVREVMAERAYSGGSIARVEFTGTWAQFARALKPHITIENDRSGPSARR